MQNLTLFERAKLELGLASGDCLRSVNDVKQYSSESVTDISEWLALEKAARLGADYVYFRKFENQPSHPLILIYDYTNKAGIPENHELGEIQKNIWSSGEVPCTFIFSKDSVQILNTTRSPEKNGEELSPTFLIEKATEISEEIKKRFSVYQLSSGEFWEDEATNFSYDRSAHQTLLSKLKNVREQLIASQVFGDNVHLINRLLIQCVLIRFLEEKKDYDENGNELKVFPPDFFQRIADAQSFREAIQKGTFTKVFDYLNNPDNLNGQIFEWTAEEQQILLNIPSKQLDQFLYQTDTNEDSQKAFWDLYSFRFLPVEVISSIYEALFTTVESVREDGMVYTPPHLASFLIEEAMPLTNFAEKKDYKILDPACGSGVFLVLAFKRMVHWWRLRHQGKAPSSKNLTEILENSIYGVDENENAVLLTRFSLCLAICDLLTPPEIWSNLHFPTLENQLTHNDFFKWYAINEGKVEFDMLIGNPPFVQGHKNLPEWQTISGYKIPQKQIALYFLSAGRRMLKDKGLLCMILKSSSFLYTTSGNDYRKQFFAENQVHQILDFTLLARNHVLWANEEPDTCAVFATKEEPKTSKSILHLVLKRTPSSKVKQYFEIDTYDFHWVDYVSALQDDFVWKCNLVGGGRFYNLIKRLRFYPKLKDFTLKKGWFIKEGYRKLAPEKIEDNPASYITNKPTLPTKWIKEDGINNWDFPIEKAVNFKEIRNEELFKFPHIVIREILSGNQIPMDFIDFHAGFQRDVVGISAPPEEKKQLIKLFSFLKHNSNLFHAIILATSPRCLVFRNTSIRATDIYNLPVLKDLADEKLNITSLNKKLISDINKYYQFLIRQPESAEILHPIPNIKLPKRIQQYSDILCQTLNKLHQKDNLRFRLSEVATFHYKKFIRTTFYYDELPDLVMPKTFPEITGNELEKLLILDKGHTRFKRILKIYQKDCVHFIKPNELRYWLDSIAFRDADGVIADLVGQLS